MYRGVGVDRKVGGQAF